MRTTTFPNVTSIHRGAGLVLALALLLVSGCTGAVADENQAGENGAPGSADSANTAAIAENGLTGSGEESPPAIVFPTAPAADGAGAGTTDVEETADNGATAPATGPDPVTFTPTGLIETSFAGRAATLALADDGTVFVVNAAGRQIFFHWSTDGGQTFAAPVHLNPDVPYEPTGLNRPVIVTGAPGAVTVAWLEILGAERSVTWEVNSSDGGRSFSAPRAAFELSEHHGLLLNGDVDGASRFLFAWLQYGQLFAVSGVGSSELLRTGRVVDDEVCDCCQPAPLVLGDAMFIAYRNLEYGPDERQIRDIYLLRSDDDGATFNPPVPVADAHWYLDSCPTSGPVLTTAADGRLYVAFTDGRLDDGSRTRSDIYLAVSSDGGQSFGPNVRINQADGGYNRGTTLAVAPDGTIHVSWQAYRDGGQNILYAISSDGGQTFSDPWPLVRGSDGSGRGNPESPSLAIAPDGSIHFTWVDRLGVHYATWRFD